MLTDSQSAIRALSRGPWCQKSALRQEIWEMLRVVEERFDAHVTVAYVPGHANLDLHADAEAKGAARDAVEAGDDRTPISFGLAQSVLRDYGRQRQWAAVERDSAWWHATGLTRGQERIVAQLRAGKSPVLADYRHACKWLDSSACACGAPSESVQHLVLNCPLHEN